MKSKESQVLSLKIPRRIARKLSLLANRSGRTRTEIVLAALERYIDDEGQASKGSFLEAIHDLVGRFDGPPDLSSNKRYMKSFGRS